MLLLQMLMHGCNQRKHCQKQRRMAMGAPPLTRCLTGSCINQVWSDTAGYLNFQPTAQCVVHALIGLACRARVTPASSALTSP